MDRRAADVRLLVFYLSLGLVRVCEIELSHMGKNKGNPDLVCEKICFSYHGASLWTPVANGEDV